MTINSPQVTILLPVYNASRYLGECVDSLLNQTFRDFELLIINDGSTDNSIDICESYDDPRIRIVHNPGNKGITYTLNRGIELAKANLVARMDADDIVMPNRLAVQVAYLDAHPEVGAVSSWITPINHEGRRIKYLSKTPAEHDYISWALMFRNPIFHPTIMYRTDLVKALDGYGTQETYAEDFYLWSRLHKISPIHILPQSLITYRVHTASVCNQHSTKQGYEASRIVRENMESHLGETVPASQAQILFYAAQGLKTSYSSVEIKSAIMLLEKLYTTFLEKSCQSSSTQNYMVQDIRGILRPILLSLPLSERTQVLTTPFLRQMLNLRLLFYTLHDWKETMKALLKRKPLSIMNPDSAH